MISVWPKFYPATNNYQELDAAGFMYRGNVEAGAKDWVGPGYTHSFYDPYSEAARDMYWRQVNEQPQRAGRRRLVDGRHRARPALQSRHRLDQGAHRAHRDGPGARFFNSYPLVHSGGVYEGARAARPDKRVFILTRSGFAGMQRNAAAVWSGDIASRWDDLYNQISAGVSIATSGLPNWTFDIGGFAQRSALQHAEARSPRTSRSGASSTCAGSSSARSRRCSARTANSRCARSSTSRRQGSRGLRQPGLARQAALPPAAVHLHAWPRTPIIATAPSCAAWRWTSRTTLAARDVRDEYLFGKAFLVAPVYQYKARTRLVYLPAGAGWYDFHTGARTQGGQKRRGGGAARAHAAVRARRLHRPGRPRDPVLGREARRADHAAGVHRRRRQLRLYEDDGVSYGYEKGEFARIPLRYDAAKGTLTIGARTGSYPGMPEERTFNVRWIKDGAKAAVRSRCAKADATV